MKVTIEVVADERSEIVTLVREVATKLKRRKEESGKTVNYCMGDYRVIVEDDPDAPACPLCGLTREHTHEV